MPGRFWRLALIVTLLSGCSAWQQHRLDQRYGPSAVPVRAPAAAHDEPEYRRDVQPILETRCAVCHGCYDAPCQLKLDAWEGLERGASKARVYDGTRLLAAELSRLFLDAPDAAAWRQKGFHPVLNERAQTAEANREASVIYRLLALKQANPLPPRARLPDSFDLALNRNQQCPSIEEFDRFASRYPLWGMPYGLPGLPYAEQQTLLRWIEQGAAVSPAPALPAAYQTRIEQWEALLNGDRPQDRLASRYLYEHLFHAHLHFGELPPGRFFQMVRSATPPGQPIALIATRRPYDDPGVDRVYYRLQPVPAAVLAKAHIPFALDTARMARWRQWFFDTTYTVTALPGYEPVATANPFLTFRELPADSRYRFLLDDARFIIEGFIKGPVCRGQIALNVIEDRFWVFFVDPGHTHAAIGDGDFLAKASRVLRLPAEQDSNALPTAHWTRYAGLQQRWLRALGDYARRHYPDGLRPGLDLIWDGDGHNRSAALTVFRHHDSASIVQGMVGSPPKTAWLINYPLLERIHYLLVAGFDVYGNVGHQFNTRMHMDFLRMEGESNFLLLLPESARARERAHWYRQAPARVMKYVDGRWLGAPVEPAIDYQSQNPKHELFTHLRRHLGTALDHRYALESATLPPVQKQALRRLSDLQGRRISLLPDAALLSLVDDNGGLQVFTLLRDSAHKNLSSLFAEDRRRLPSEDRLTVVPGIIAAYPNAFYRVRHEDLPAFVEAVADLRNERHYRRLLDRFGVRRTDPQFWSHSDRVHAFYRAHGGIEAGLLDFNRLENR